MERFVSRQNIEHYKGLLKTIDDSIELAKIEKLLLKEEAKLKKAEENHEKK